MNTNLLMIRYNAALEIERDLRREFFENHKFFWWKCPIRDRDLAVLIASSKSITNGPCKGGLINARGRPDRYMTLRAHWLSANGYLGEYGTSKEFEPTLLGWAVLDAFAKDEACFPEQVQRSLREFYGMAERCLEPDKRSTRSDSCSEDAVPPSQQPGRCSQKVKRRTGSTNTKRR